MSVGIEGHSLWQYVGIEWLCERSIVVVGFEL